MDPNQVLEQIIDILETEYKLDVSQENKFHLTIPLKKLYGEAYKEGLQQGVNVSRQFDGIKNK